jgi:hypothetical protein
MRKFRQANLIWLIVPVLFFMTGCDLIPKASEETVPDSGAMADAGEAKVLAGETNPKIENTPPPEYAGLVSESGEIRVNAPGIDDVIKGSVTVAGVARTFENTVMIRIKDADGNILAETTATTDAPEVGQFGDFEQAVAFSAPQNYDQPGVIEVFEQSMKDGDEQNKVSIPVGFAK